ncbi:MAG: hypothetical protein ACLQU1_44215 [Bryobacteraceae bacterium]
MRFFGGMAVLLAGTSAWASDAAQAPKRVVRACMNPGANASMMYRGQGTATQILKQAGIRLDWRTDERACTEGNGIVVTVSRETPVNQHSGALAYAMPYERTHIVLLYDRVLNAAGPAVAPSLLGHVLAHEIVHMLQGVNVHSASGVMKAHWNSQDFADMQRGRLKLTIDDIDLIDHGLGWRVTPPVQPNGQPQ